MTVWKLVYKRKSVFGIKVEDVFIHRCVNPTQEDLDYVDKKVIEILQQRITAGENIIEAAISTFTNKIVPPGDYQ
jgi:hypothetical protein